MRKLILIASLLMAGGLWAETPEVCQILDNKNKSALAQILEQGCREGDALMWTARAGVAQYWIARFCILDKPIVIINEVKGVCTLGGGALMPRTSGK